MVFAVLCLFYHLLLKFVFFLDLFLLSDIFDLLLQVFVVGSLLDCVSQVGSDNLLWMCSLTPRMRWSWAFRLFPFTITTSGQPSRLKTVRHWLCKSCSEERFAETDVMQLSSKMFSRECVILLLSYAFHHPSVLASVSQLIAPCCFCLMYLWTAESFILFFVFPLLGFLSPVWYCFWNSLSVSVLTLPRCGYFSF